MRNLSKQFKNLRTVYQQALYSLINPSILGVQVKLTGLETGMDKKLVLIILLIFMSGCTTLAYKTPEQQKEEILAMQKEVLIDLYKTKPKAESEISQSPGYAVFSNANVNVIFASFGGGYGVVTDNKTGKHTYMKMGEIGVGLGLGVKDFRSIFIFKDRETMQTFINSGWEVGGHADAAAKADEKGAAIGGELLIDKIKIYQLTKSGLALQATVKGTRYWKDDGLN